jgi:hypothetical protein
VLSSGMLTRVLVMAPLRSVAAPPPMPYLRHMARPTCRQAGLRAHTGQSDPPRRLLVYRASGKRPLHTNGNAFLLQAGTRLKRRSRDKPVDATQVNKQIILLHPKKTNVLKKNHIYISTILCNKLNYI